MDSIFIEGPNRLEGVISASGAKNAVLPIMAASILAEHGITVLHDVPQVSDVKSMVLILKSLGAKVESVGNTLKIDATGVNTHTADYKYVSTMRASVCLMGPLLARFRKAKVSLPGGCVIGQRPIDLHLKGFEALGVKIELEHGYVHANAKKLKATRLYLGGAFGSSVLATANVMMAAVAAKGTTSIVNAACEPEVIDLGNFLKRMGAKIEGLGSPVIQISGGTKLKGCEHRILPDRIEAGTYMVAAAMTRGDVTIKNASSETLGVLCDKLTHAGVSIQERKGQIRVRCRNCLKPVSVTTHVYPGFPTDLQAQMMALMCITPGISVITEKIFPDRFMHVSELNRMGAEIRLEGPNAIVNGRRTLSGAPVMASDLRASAALVIAGLAAHGTTQISRVYHLDRGYEKLEKKFQSLGAKIRRQR